MRFQQVFILVVEDAYLKVAAGNAAGDYSWMLFLDERNYTGFSVMVIKSRTRRGPERSGGV